MILLFITALLFLFLSTTIGFFVTKLMAGSTFINYGIFNSLLIGTVAITVYLNILSLFLPVNYFLLVPVFLISVTVTLRSSIAKQSLVSIHQNVEILFSKRNWMITSSVIAVLILYALVPPYNTDSSGYHFLSILWNEKYKAVPGLANLFPQYGFNSSFFVLSAAFSFTGIFGQSMYPINMVLIVFFFLWMLKKSFGYNDFRRILIWCMMVVFLRQFPISLSSPSADALASIIVLFILFKLAQPRSPVFKTEEWAFLILLAFFAVTIKLSTLPVVLVLLVPLIIYKTDSRSVLFAYFRLIPYVSLIIIPWLARNVILSGYLIFPFPAIDIFSFDWKVPLNITIAENLHISHAPRMVDENWKYVDTLSIPEWLPTYLRNLWRDDHFNYLLVIAGLVAPAAFVIRKFKTSCYLLPWLISYIAIWFWLITSPDIRFGYHYLLPCIFFPLFLVSEGITLKAKPLLTASVSIVICMICLYHDYHAIKRLQPYRVSEYFYTPLKSPEYYKNNDLSTFKYVMLTNNVKLYIHDSAHHSINAPMPACSPYRPGIKMRGSKLEDGFKTAP